MQIQNSKRKTIVYIDGYNRPPVEWIGRNLSGIKVTVYIPALPHDQSKRRLDYFSNSRLPVDCKFLPLDGLPHHQLKAAIKLPDGKFAVRPGEWVRRI